MSLKTVYGLAKKVNCKLTCKDFGETVYIHHGDGSFFVVRESMATYFNEYYVIFSEHHMPLIYAKDDLEWIQSETSFPIQPTQFVNLKALSKSKGIKWMNTKKIL